MKRLFMVALIMLSASGCAAPMIWNKAGATQADYNKDSYSCEKDARQSGYFGRGIAGSINMQEFFKKCMVAHGWTLRQQSGSSQNTDFTIIYCLMDDGTVQATSSTSGCEAISKFKGARAVQISKEEYEKRTQ